MFSIKAEQPSQISIMISGAEWGGIYVGESQKKSLITNKKKNLKIRKINITIKL